MRGSMQWMPLVVLSTRFPASLTPASSRRRSTQGPAQLTMTAARTACTRPVSRSRTRTPSMPPAPRVTSSTSQ